MSKNTLNISKILDAALQSEAVKKVVLREVEKYVEKRRKASEIAYRQLVSEILKVVRRGIPGPTSRGGFVTVKAGRESVRVSWAGLNPEYRKSKVKFGTSDRFWKRSGGLAGAATAPTPSAKAEITTRLRGGINVLEKRGGSATIRVGAVLKFSTLPFPLNDLVRTPFLTGDTPEFGKYSERVAGFKGLSLLILLEGGTENSPARPFIADLSVKLGRKLRAQSL